MNTEPRTVTLPTIDHGDVTLAEPEWCSGHADHRPDANRADITHNSPETPLSLHGRSIGFAHITQAPLAEKSSRAIEASVVLGYEPRRGLTPPDLYDLAADLDAHADRLRDLADQLARIIARGGQ